MYERAFEMAQTLEDEDKEKTLPMTTRIRTRVVALERTALASSVFATIQESKVCGSHHTIPASDEENLIHSFCVIFLQFKSYLSLE